MRAAGTSRARIAATLGVHLATAYRHTDGVRSEPQADNDTFITYHAHNGGCSTQSGMMPIRMPLIRSCPLQVAA